MRSRIEAARQIFHHGRYAAAAPACGEHEVTEQETQSVPDVKADGCHTRTVCHPSGPRERPRAESGHETTQACDQPGNAAAASKVFGRAAVEAQNVKPYAHHQERIQGDNRIIDEI